jgi:hypothetical protein
MQKWHHGNKEPKLKTTGTSEEGGENHKWHRSVDIGRQLLLGSGRMHMKALYVRGNVKIAKQNTGFSARMQSIKDWTLWRGRPPPKWLKSGSHA